MAATTIRTPQPIGMANPAECEIICTLQMMYLDGIVDRVDLDDWDWLLDVPEALFRRGYSMLEIGRERLEELVDNYDAWLDAQRAIQPDCIIEDTDKLRKLYRKRVRPFMEGRMRLYQRYSMQYSREQRLPVASDFGQLLQQGYRVFVDTPADTAVGWTIIGLVWAAEGELLRCYDPGRGNVLYRREQVLRTDLVAWKRPRS